MNPNDNQLFLGFNVKDKIYIAFTPLFLLDVFPEQSRSKGLSVKKDLESREKVVKNRFWHFERIMSGELRTF